MRAEHRRPSPIRRALAVACLACSIVAGAPSTADAAPQADTTTAEARLRFDEGIKLADNGAHEAARLKFNQAWALLKSPAILYNLARAEQLSSHPVEALEHYRLFGKMSSDPKITEVQRQRAAENVAELSKKVGQIDIEAPAGARITIDGRTIDWAPGADPVVVTPGKHAVEASVDGKPRNVEVDCQPGTITKAKLVDPPAPVAAAPAPGPALTEPPKEPEPGFWTTGRAVGVGLVGTGLVAAGIGVFFHLQSESSADDVTSLQGKLPPPKESACRQPSLQSVADTCNDLRDAVKAEDREGTLRTAFLVSGGALVVGGAVLFLVSPPQASKRESPHAMRFVPYASAREGGFALSGRF